MSFLNGADPAQFLTGHLDRFNHDLIHTDDDPAVIVDRYHTPDIVQTADGHRMDRDDLIAHTRPVRKTKPTARIEVHDALADGDRLAAHYTMHVKRRKRNLVMEVHMFARFADDGRMRESNMLIRTVSNERVAAPTTEASPE